MQGEKFRCQLLKLSLEQKTFQGMLSFFTPFFALYCPVLNASFVTRAVNNRRTKDHLTECLGLNQFSHQFNSAKGQKLLIGNSQVFVQPQNLLNPFSKLYMSRLFSIKDNRGISGLN